MFTFLWPYAFLAIPAPLLWRALSSRIESGNGAIRVPFFDAVKAANGGISNAKKRHNIAAYLLWITWCLTVTALARPTWIGEPISLPQEQRDLMLAVDISRSMAEQDMLQPGSSSDNYVDRLSTVKSVVGDFVNRRADRMGLILFGQQAYLQTPLTFDRNIVKQQLREALIGFAGDATAIGDAIGIAVKRLRDRPAESRVLILLTDGANTAGASPLDAVAVAKDAGIRIHTIGIGASQIKQRGFFGRVRTVNPSSGLDENTLKRIASETGGEYFRAEDPTQLSRIYAALDQLEPVAQEQLFRPQRSVLHVPLLAALCVLLLVLATRSTARSFNILSMGSE